MTGMSAPLPAGAVRIVNGEVVRSSDVETGYGGAPVTPAPSTNTFNWLGGEKHRAYKILAVLVFFVAFGIRAAVPMVLLYILYQVFGVVRSNNESSSFGSFGGGGSTASTSRSPPRRAGSNVRTVSDLPKPPPSS